MWIVRIARRAAPDAGALRQIACGNGDDPVAKTQRFEHRERVVVGGGVARREGFRRAAHDLRELGARFADDPRLLLEPVDAEKLLIAHLSRMQMQPDLVALRLQLPVHVPASLEVRGNHRETRPDSVGGARLPEAADRALAQGRVLKRALRRLAIYLDG